MPKGGRWEGSLGNEYRRDFKRENYDALTIQFRKDGRDGLTREAVKKAAEAHGLTAAEYIKALLKADMDKGDLENKTN